jgi:hypothetical protein
MINRIRRLGSNSMKTNESMPCLSLNFSPLVEWRSHDHNTHHGKGLRAMSTIRLIVYDPPEDGYPFLAVALSPTREVSAVAYDTRQEAEAHNAALATEAARAKPSGDQDA